MRASDAKLPGTHSACHPLTDKVLRDKANHVVRVSTTITQTSLTVRESQSVEEAQGSKGPYKTAASGDSIWPVFIVHIRGKPKKMCGVGCAHRFRGYNRLRAF